MGASSQGTAASAASIVVVGAGLCAASAAETLREEGHTGSLTLVGAEERLHYERPQLSKDVLAGGEVAELHWEEWYEEHAIEVLTGVRAIRLDPHSRRIVLDDGGLRSYDRALIATGAQARVPDLPGAEHAVTLRTAEDAEALRDLLAPGTRVALIGGGWIGLEVAAAAIGRGASAVVLEREELPLLGVLGRELAGYVAEVHRSHGVELRTGVGVEAIEPDGVRTSAGLVAADLIVLAVGAVPETGLAEDAGLHVAAPAEGGGIVVDSRLRTSDPHLWAAGDVARAEHTLLGPIRVEHWDNAIRQGALAARSMLDQDAVYDWQPYFYTDQFEFSMEYVGRSAAEDEVVVRGDRARHELVAYWRRAGTITAGMNVGIWDVNDRLRELIGRRIDPADLTDLR